MELLSSIEIELSPPAKKSVIWLHGLGADGNDFVPIVHELKFPPNLSMRFIFPNAPIKPVTLNNGYQMRAWFDIYELSLDAKIDKAGIDQSVFAVQQLISKEIERGLKTSDIFLAGFSQGATIALTTGLCYPERLAGIVALSGYLPNTQELLKKASPANRTIPIFFGHGTQDPLVSDSLGKSVYEILKSANYPAVWHTYSMRHSVCGDEIQDLSDWFQQTTLNTI